MEEAIVLRGKYKCIKTHLDDNGTGNIVIDIARYDKETDKLVFDLQPEGLLEIRAINAKAMRRLVKDKEYFIDIVEA